MVHADILVPSASRPRKRKGRGTGIVKPTKRLCIARGGRKDRERGTKFPTEQQNDSKWYGQGSRGREGVGVGERGSGRVGKRERGKRRGGSGAAKGARPLGKVANKKSFRGGRGGRAVARKTSKSKHYSHSLSSSL